VLLGGVLTAAFGWEAIFFVNVPAGLIVLVALPFLVARDAGAERMRLDLAGALTVTGGLVSLVGALSLSEQLGFADPLIIGLFVAAAVLLAAFVVIERRSAQPLVDLRIFRLPSVAGGNAAMLFAGAATTATFFALSVYMQQVLGYSALESGLTQLPLAGTLVVVAGVVPSVLARFGARRVLVVALLVLALGLLWLSFAPSDATFVGSLLAPTIVIGAGLGASFIATTQLAVDGTSGSDAGLASGLVNTSQQVGGALGLAVLSTIGASRAAVLMASGTAKADALTSGFSVVFLGAAAAAVLGAIAVTVITRSRANSTAAEGRGRS
jgi:predicted MFS family arabinose efflux permease